MRRTICLFCAMILAGCSQPGLRPVKTMQEIEQLHKEETKAERAELEELEKKLGKDHPHVKQKRMELGIDPFPTGSGNQ